jgi:hypothetical protein
MCDCAKDRSIKSAEMQYNRNEEVHGNIIAENHNSKMSHLKK